MFTVKCRSTDPLMAVWAYFTVGALLWTRSTDKISEVISHFASVQSNSEALEGSCQSMVYRSVILCKLEQLVIMVKINFCPNRYPLMRQSMGCNCICIVNVFPLVSFYFPQRFTHCDETNWATYITRHCIHYYPVSYDKR